MGARTDAARAEVLARRGALADEIQGLEASARAAADIPAKVRRNPVKTVGAAGGAAFVLLGGPQRLFRRARRAVQGPNAGMPKALLPDEVERTLRGLGDDGDRVRATVEVEFAKWLRDRAKLTRDSDAKAAAVAILSLALKPAATQVGRQLAKQVMAPDRAGFEAALAKVRGRVGKPATPPPARAPGTPPPAGESRPAESRAATPPAPRPEPGPRP